jgi:hypothetical protein
MLRTYAERHRERSGFISITDVVCREDVAPCDDRIEGETARRDGVHYEGAGEERVIDARSSRCSDPSWSGSSRLRGLTAHVRSVAA